MKDITYREGSEKIMIYFDNSATTAMDSAVLATYDQTAKRIIGNPSSLHKLGEEASLLLRKARTQIAHLIGCQPNEIYFTSGGTEGDNWVLKGTAIEKREFGRHIIVSAIEHPAVLETAHQLSQLGFDVELAPVTKEGVVNVEALASMIRKDTILVSVMAVNNEIGTIQPIEAISNLLEAYPNIHFHVDAVQAIGKIPTERYLTPRVDFATFSAHKFHGPRGIGFMYWKTGRRLAPLLTGGGQESNERSGTENVPAIVAEARALRLLFEDADKKQHYERQMIASLRDGLEKYDKVTIFTPNNDHITAPHILCFGIEGVRGEVLVHALEEHDIYISTTSACSSRKHLPAGTLKAMGIPQSMVETAVRISLDSYNKADELAKFMSVFNQLYQRFLKVN